MSTFTWGQVKDSRWRLVMRASALRMISAISNRGRVTAAVLRRLRRRLRQTGDVNAFEGIDSSVQVAPRKMHVQGRVLQLLVTHQELKRRQIGPTLDEVGRESMPPMPSSA